MAVSVVLIALADCTPSGDSCINIVLTLACAYVDFIHAIHVLGFGGLGFLVFAWQSSCWRWSFPVALIWALDSLEHGTTLGQ